MAASEPLRSNNLFIFHGFGPPPEKKKPSRTPTEQVGRGGDTPQQITSDFRGESLKGTGTISECQEAIRLRARLLARHAQWTLVSTLAGFVNNEKGPRGCLG